MFSWIFSKPSYSHHFSGKSISGFSLQNEQLNLGDIHSSKLDQETEH